MAVYFSEHFAAASTATVAPPTALVDPRIKSQEGTSGSSLQMSRTLLDFTGLPVDAFAAEDQLRFCTMRSNDRIYTMRLSNVAAWAATALTMDLGLYAPGLRHDGAVLDIDLFADRTTQSLVGTLAQTDVLLEATTLVDEDRGKPLWEMLAAGAGSDTSDPVVSYDIVGTIGTVTSITAHGPLLLEIEFVPGARN